MVIVSYSSEYFASLEQIFTFWNDYTGNTKYSQKIQKELNRTIKIIKENVFIFPSVINSNYFMDLKQVRRATILNNFSLYYEVNNNTSITILFLRDNRRNPI